MEPSQTTFIYSLWKFIDPPFQKPHRSPVQISHMEPLQKHLQIHHRNLIHPLCRDLIETHYIEELQIPYRDTFQKPIMDPSYGALIVNLFIYIPYPLETPCRSLIWGPYRKFYRFHTETLQILYIETVQKPMKDLLSCFLQRTQIFVDVGHQIKLPICIDVPCITRSPTRNLENVWKFYP